METFDIVTNCVDESGTAKRKNKRKLTKKVTFAAELDKIKEADDEGVSDEKRLKPGDNTPAEGVAVAPQRRFSARRLKGKKQETAATTPPPGTTIAAKIQTKSAEQQQQKHSHAASSSIFTKNPEIPKMNKGLQMDMNEALFSTKTFTDLGIHPYLVSNMRQLFGIDKLTVVQEYAIPAILSGQDVLIKSQTGSGKTFAYAVPIVQILQEIEPKVKRENGIYAVIVVPTRELAVQTFEWFHRMLKSFNRIVPSCFMGGQKRKSEKANLRRGVNVLVTTPQRFIDHLKNSQQMDISRVRWLVLDEADRMTDMGYEKDVSFIVKALKQELAQEGTGQTLQVIMASATLSEGVDRLAGLSLASPLVIDCAIETNATEKPHQMVTPANLSQHFLVTPVKLKLVTLAAFVLWKCKGDRHKLLVFLPTQDMVDFHAKLFNHILDDEQQVGEDEADLRDRESSVTINQLHGNMSQHERTEVFKEFRAAKAGVLLCTDVASRGLDLPQVHWIVQYSAPTSAADYVHRVGRTARIGTEGNALLLLLPSETGYVKYLEENNINVHQMTVESILDALPRVQNVRRNKNEKGPSQTLLRSAEEAATSLQVTCERAVKTDMALSTAARNAFQSYVRFYSTYPAALRSMFQFKELHLGHVAKSMALLETPSALGTFRKPPSAGHQQQRGNNSSGFRGHNEQRQSANVTNDPVKLMLLEYESGI